VLTGEDVAADGLGDLPCLRQMKKRDGAPMYQPPRPAWPAPAQRPTFGCGASRLRRRCVRSPAHG